MWKWNNKKIAFVAILIAASATFVFIGSRLAAITIFPPFKIAFGGLPIKITGYLFGPLIGAITGVISDLLSFVMLPTYYHPLYTIIMMISGIIPGIVSWIFVKRKTSINTNYVVTMILLILIFIIIFGIIHRLPKDSFNDSPIKQRWILQALACGGYVLFAIVATFFRFFKKGYHMKLIAPVIIMIAILDVNNSLLIPLADNQSLKIPYVTAWIGHLVTSPLKLLTNLIVISLTIKVIAPLVKNKLDNAY